MESRATIRTLYNPADALFWKLRTAIELGNKGSAVNFHEPYHLYLLDSQADMYMSLMQNAPGRPLPSCMEEAPFDAAGRLRCAACSLGELNCAFHSSIRQLMSAQRERLLTGLGNRFEIVDLGPGYPDKTFPLLQQARDQGSSCRYVPVDISPKFLRIAAEASSQFGFPVYPRQCLFEDLVSSLDRTDPGRSRLFMMGVTFMNYCPGAAVDLLAGLLQGGDAAVIATELLGARSIEEVLAPYRTSKARAFNLMPLLMCGMQAAQGRPRHSYQEGTALDAAGRLRCAADSLGESALRYFVRFRECRIEMGFKARGAARVRDIQVPAGTEIITAVSCRYPASELLSLLKRTFPKVDLFEDSLGTSAIARVSMGC